MTPQEAQQRAEATCTEVVRRMLIEHADKPISELAALIGKRWANLGIAIEGSIRRQTAEQCADIAERWGEVTIRDEINDKFGLGQW